VSLSLADTLLEAIRAEPSDPTAWPALADHLEEEGDPRAELVRLTHELRHAPFTKARRARENRLCQLLLAGLRPLVPVLTNSIGLELALVPPGRFRMGSLSSEDYHTSDEGPVHEVQISKPFYLGVYPVTQDEYQTVMGVNPSHFSPHGPIAFFRVREQDTGRFPVDSVSWDLANAFCARLSDLPAERAAGRTYRLPTEAEWEYACRAGTSTAFCFGDRLSSQLANFDGGYPYGGASRHVYLKRTCPVGRYPPNAFGLYDMHGNIWEWCGDWYHESYYRRSPPRDPPGPAAGEAHLLRGGSWIDASWHCRSADRSRSEALHYVGVRVALSAGQPGSGRHA
jgi:uncharacterized protein (TIGR02996 family)